MGKYFNPGNEGFGTIRKSIFVDKSDLISYINNVLNTSQNLICVSRPRRFGKSLSAQMLSSYYSKGCSSDYLFSDLNISRGKETYLSNLNKHNVIYLDITWFINIDKNSDDKLVSVIEGEIISELQEVYSDIKGQYASLATILADISSITGEKFIFIIDEWDAVFREFPDNEKLQKAYIKLLRGLFKSNMTPRMIEAAYITGILPIRKYGTESALTDFYEYTMVNPGDMVQFMGFTEDEVCKLCENNNMSYSDIKDWYDGYILDEKHLYSPKSVLDAIKFKRVGTYWTQTETYEALKSYINMNFDGLKDNILNMLLGHRIPISTRKFQNAINVIKSKDDVMTLLVHLGYLAYDINKEEVWIPNLEITSEFKNAIEDSGWEIISQMLQDSAMLLKKTLDMDELYVAKAIEKVHSDNISILSYNSEVSLANVITLAYYTARKEYIIKREFPTGKGFADLVFLPRKNKDLPAIVVELKRNHSAKTAIKQIRTQNYPSSLQEYTGKILLVGINYSKKTNKHTCRIDIVLNTLEGKSGMSKFRDKLV